MRTGVGQGWPPEAFVRENLRVTRLDWLDGLKVHAAHPGSGLWRLRALAAMEDAAPYWAYVWAGGAALARFLLDRPETAAGKRVLDIGTGCGIVAIAAAKAGAAEVTAFDLDPYAVAAARLNASLNEVAITVFEADMSTVEVPETVLVLAGDVFYDPDVAKRSMAFIDRAIARGCTVLVGDPGRKPLPRERLNLLAEYDVPDVGSSDEMSPGAVYAFIGSPRD